MAAPRKGRLPRLGASHIAGSIDYVPKGRDWMRIEKAFGRELDPAVRSSIVNVVKDYFRDESFERGAPLVRDIADRMARIDHAARDLKRSMLDNPKKSAAGPEFQAKLMIERILDDLPEPAPHNWDVLSRTLTALIGAIARAKKELDMAAFTGLAAGDAWNRLICALTEIATEHGLPIGVTKGLDKTSSNAPSAFVRFVMALQGTFPSEARRHDFSYSAAAQAISVARRKNKK